MLPRPLVAMEPSSVSDAKLAYFEGDFELCLDICDKIRVGTVETASEVALLRARAYLRTGRAREARGMLLETRDTHVSLDASLTAQMLLATALIRQDDADGGIAMLEEATNRSHGAHFAVVSEIAFTTALGYWAKREIDRTEEYLERVDPRSDIIHARALELQAWCHTARGDYRRSAEYFCLTLVRLDDCRAGDRAITATAICTLAIFAAELFDRDIARFVESRAQRMDWKSGLSAQHYLTLFHQALFREFCGETVEAIELATCAREVAPTVPFEVLAWGLSSAIARNAGEASCAIAFARRARRLLDTLDGRALVGDERFSILSVAENSAHFDPDRAATLFTRYAGLAPVDRMCALAADPRLNADETYIEGVIAHARGDHDHARACYRKAFTIFREIGYVRRAVTTAHALLQITRDDDLLQYIDSQLAGTANYVTWSLRGADHAGALLDGHPTMAALPPSQREVTLLVCSGLTNKEIAALRNVGEQTIKNMLTKSVFPAFGVSNRAALVSLCLGRASARQA